MDVIIFRMLLDIIDLVFMVGGIIKFLLINMWDRLFFNVEMVMLKFVMMYWYGIIIKFF